MLSMYTCGRWIIYIYIVIENRADSDVMPPVFSLSKYPIEYLTLDT